MNAAQTLLGFHTLFINSNAGSSAHFSFSTRCNPRNAVTRILAAQ